MNDKIKIVECVPNFSEGRSKEKMDKIQEPFRTTTGVKLLDHQADKDHNRMVVTAAGEPNAIIDAVVKASSAAVSLIDLNKHQGQHPRMGAVDVVPFIPIRNFSMEEAIELSKKAAKRIGEECGIPVILYEASATAPHRSDLSRVRKGEFEKMAGKLNDPMWKPDFGPDKVHPTAGVTAVGARMPLVAFNVNLDTDNIEIAMAIAKKVRHISGGLRFCKAMGLELKERGIVQVSMNMTNYKQTALYSAFELIRLEAGRYGAQIIGSEIVGMIPMEAMADTCAYYLGLENFSFDQILETKIME